MTREQEQHLQSLKESFLREFDAKYRRGQAEHGGSLFEMPMLDLIRNAKEEVLDQWAFLCTLEDQLIEELVEAEHYQKLNSPPLMAGSSSGPRVISPK